MRATAPSALPSSVALHVNPSAVILCLFGGGGQPAKGRPAGGVVLDGRPAQAIARLLNAEPAVPLSSPACSTQDTEVLLRFIYSGGRTSNVSIGCTDRTAMTTIAQVADQPRVVDRTLSETVIAIAGSYGKFAGAAAPDLFGMDAANAMRVAQQAGFTLDSNGVEVDPAVPPGTVLLQYPPANVAGIGNQIDVVLSAPAAATCTVGQLALDYVAGGAGAGNDVGTIRIRDVDAQPCLLAGPITVTGTDRTGHAVTETIAYGVEPGLVLTARSAPVPAGSSAPPGETVGNLLLAAEYRDDPTSPDGTCSTNRVVPASWRLHFPDGEKTVPNAGTDPGNPMFSSLLTCKGQLDTPSPVSAG